MTTDKGGWTLFFNYVHVPGEDYDINPNVIPTNTEKSKSHVSLTNLGFTVQDVTEVRFYCDTSHGKFPQYIHFKSSNKGVLQTAMTGDQSSLSSKSWGSEIKDLEKPKKQKLDNAIRVEINGQAHLIDELKSPIGSFYNTPFGTQEGKFTVKGVDKKGGRWECGDSLDKMEGANYYTTHQVWFRGIPPNKKFIQARQYVKQLKSYLF